MNFARLRIAIPMVGVFAWVVVGTLGPFFMPHDPYRGNLADSLLPPIWAPGGSLRFPLGTDALGHDVFSQLIMGARLALVIAGGSLLLGAGSGTALGLVAGYYGGWIDAFLMRLADFLLAFPVLIVALLIALTFGPSIVVVVMIIAVTMWSRFVRLVRIEVLSMREREFVALARVAGASDLRVIGRHILPNVIATVIVMLTLQIGQAVLAEASLSFLGIGLPAPNPSWGAQVSANRDYLQVAWWLPVLPGVAIFLLVLSVNLVGDWLRDVFNPQLRSL